MKKPCVLFVANRAYALSNSRELLIKKFISSGWEVVIATKKDDESDKLCELGVVHEEVVFNRGGLSPLKDIAAYARLKKIVAKWQPALMHNFHAKPVILGTISAKKILKENTVVVNTITGLGHAFIMGGIPAKIAGFGYRCSIPKANCTVFQNRDDQKLFLQNNWGSKERSTLIASSGVDIQKFTRTNKPCSSTTELNIIMIGRLLKQKGILEFITIADALSKKHPKVNFILAGENDSVHPDAIDLDFVHEQKNIEYVGCLEDIVPLYESADILLFPSYREGVPRVVLEAASMQIPTVAFDVPGVREAVRQDKTGFLVTHLDTGAMLKKIEMLITDYNLRSTLGTQARGLIEKEFDIKQITEKYLDTYRSLGIPI